MGNKDIRVGIAGLGWIAEKAHIPAFSNLENVYICSFFDIVKNRAQDLAAKYKITGIYDNYDDFLKSDIDAVIIATPNFSHADYSIKALESGLHVLCEKPVAIGTEEIKKVIKTANENNRLFLPGFVNRFRYDIQKMREIVINNQIGDIVSIKAGWLRRDGIPRPGTWFTNKKHSGGGVLIDLGSHIIDICSMFLGKSIPIEMALSSKADAGIKYQAGASWFQSNRNNSLPVDVEDTAIGKIKFDKSVYLEFELSWSVPIEGDCTYFILSGTKGSIQLKTLFGFSDDRFWKEDSLFIKENNTGSIDISLDREKNTTYQAFINMAEYFIDVIRGKDMNLLNHEDAFKNVDIIEKLYLLNNKNGIDFENYKLGCDCSE